MVKQAKHDKVLARRLVAYEETLRTIKDSKAFTKPGSLKRF